MTAPLDPQRSESSPLDEARLFELLEQPELWPEDPAAQAELAGLLELHLALTCHGTELAAGLAQPRGPAGRAPGAWPPLPFCW